MDPFGGRAALLPRWRRCITQYTIPSSVATVTNPGVIERDLQTLYALIDAIAGTAGTPYGGGPREPPRRLRRPNEAEILLVPVKTTHTSALARFPFLS